MRKDLGRSPRWSVQAFNSAGELIGGDFEDSLSIAGAAGGADTMTAKLSAAQRNDGYTAAVAEALRAERAAAGLSIPALADRAGMVAVTLQKRHFRECVPSHGHPVLGGASRSLRRLAAEPAA